jgi:hypothetical protein
VVIVSAVPGLLTVKVKRTDAKAERAQDGATWTATPSKAISLRISTRRACTRRRLSVNGNEWRAVYACARLHPPVPTTLHAGHWLRGTWRVVEVPIGRSWICAGAVPVRPATQILAVILVHLQLPAIGRAQTNRNQDRNVPPM